MPRRHDTASALLATPRRGKHLLTAELRARVFAGAAGNVLTDNMAKLLWTQKQDIGPSPRFGHAMVFEAARQRVLLFGGNAGANQFLNDSWAWDGENWTQLADIGPSPRSLHAMAYDPLRDRTVLFGGQSSDAEFGDTWEWDGEAWTQIEDTGPSARFGHAMAADEARQVVTLFGGGHTAAAPESDTWTWNGTDWQQVEDTGPAARTGHAMGYDRVRNVTVLFGGNGADLSSSFGDTWEWDGNLWKRVQDIGPAPATGASLVFRTAVSALFGGISSIASVNGRKLFGLTWEWNGQHWTARQDIGVGARFRHAMAYDLARNRVVLFGGLSTPPDVDDADAKLNGDTWEHADLTSGGVTPPAGQDSPIASVSVQPNPVSAGQVLEIFVELAAPAPPQGQSVVIGGDFGELGSVEVLEGDISGSLPIQIPDNIAYLVPLPFTGTITATGSDGISVSTSFTVQ